MRKQKKWMSILLAAVMVTGLLGPASVKVRAEEARLADLVTEDCTVTASSGEDSAENAVDGDIAAPSQWASGDMKNGTEGLEEDGSQTAQWLTVDLGENITSKPIEQIKLYYNMKVWPMVYEIQTSSDNGSTDAWTTLVRVERTDAANNGAVQNGAGQDIADASGSTATGDNYDMITKTSSPNLAEDAAVERYVRFYVEQVNTSAPGNNVCLREIEIYAAEDAGSGETGGETPPETDTLAHWNLALGQPAAASSVANDCGPELAVNGVTDIAEQWNSEDMKNGTTAGQTQTPQWLRVDLGESGSTISQIKLYYNVKVWPMVYEIQTTDDDPDSENAVWETVVRVERPASDSWVTNGEGQNIADTTANTDTITTQTTPALEKTQIGRYVRFYVEKVNEVAGGNNVNLREIQIVGTNPNRTPEVDLAGALDDITASDLTIVNNQYQLPETLVQGADFVIRGSEYENVVSNDGVITQWNIGSRDVSLLLRITETADIYNYQEKNVTVTVPDHSSSYPDEWFPAVENPNERPGVVPSIQEWYGYEGSFVINEATKIVLNDAANVDLQKAAEDTQANIAEITGLTLDIVTGTAPVENSIYIEALTNDKENYDVGEEGYLLRTDDMGVQIYATTYAGAVHGMVTVEQMLWLSEGSQAIPQGIMRDYPAYALRGIKLDVARTPYRWSQILDYAKMARWYKLSEYDLHINDNDNCNIQGATYDTHAGFHRLESEEFPSLVSETKHAGIPAELVNDDYYNNNEDYQGNPTYTKDQWRELTALCEELGTTLITEIDLPGHSLLYNKYAAENPDNIDWLEGGTAYTANGLSTAGGLELLDLTGANKDRALRFAKTLWNEYTQGDDPVISGNIINIGSDEYWDHSNAQKDGFATFANELRKVIQENLGEDTIIRMWGAGSQGFSTATTVLGMTHAELAKHFQLDIWYTSYDNAKLRTTEGYQVSNLRDAYLYGNPGRLFRDVPNAEFLFNSWNPTMFENVGTTATNPSIGEPNLMGAKTVIWGDQSQEGMIEKDIHQRVLRAMSIISEKTWDGTAEDDTFADFELRVSHLAEGPGTEIAMEIESESSLVLAYDFANVSADGTIVYDASGNGYDASVTGGSVSDGWMTFDGNTLMETSLKTLSYPYTVSFDLKLSSEDGAANDEESSLFSGYDGRIQVAGFNGNLSADVNYFTRNLDYQVPTDGTEVNVTIVGTFQATKLYVNGELVTNLFQQNVANDGLLSGAIQTLYSSVVLPLEKIGQDFHGQMANLKVYNKALTAEEINGEDDGFVNVAQDTHAGSSSYHAGDAYDDGVQRTSIAAKAIDGETFAETTGTPDISSSEQTSYWKGDHADSALTIDLGQERTISKVGIHWRTDGRGSAFQIQTSDDGENWSVAKEISNNTEYFQTIELDTPVAARYVRMQGVSGTYAIQEFLVYEKVEKDTLDTVLAEAEEVVKSEGMTFENASGEELFQAVVLARALSESPLATKEEVTAAAESLRTLLDRTPDDPSQEVCEIFTDVTHGSWYEEAVQYVYDKGLMEGNGDKFTPNGKMTRGMFVTTLYRLAGEPEITDRKACTELHDVAEGAWYTDAVCWAYANGITTGYENDMTFRTNVALSREQVATFLYRYAQFIGKDVDVSDDLSGLLNADKVKPYAAKEVKWAVGAGIISGKEIKDEAGNNVYDLAPQGTATRAEMAKILMNFCNAYSI